jgi:glycosyltransferase involved in cell wall biosynthesis
MADGPSISCLMVTRPVPGRLERLKRSVAGYIEQTHEPRELVVVVHGGEAEPTTAAIKAHVASLGRGDLRVLQAAETLTLGALRNVSLANALGDVVCQWDDDDLYHPQRLERQLEALVSSGAEGVCLQEVMQFFPAGRRLYCTNWRATEAMAHPGTLMAWSGASIVYPEGGDTARLGEDLAVVRQLQQRGAYGVLAGQPHLHVYVSHGGNSWDDAHHRMLADRLGLSQGLLRRREAALREGLAVFDFGAGPVTVEGANGPAFTLGGEA